MPSFVMITGANSGIGLEFAKQYAAEGWSVIATHRRDKIPDSLAELGERFKNVTVERMDVQSRVEVLALAAKLNGAPIDLLINNAGIFSVGDWRDQSDNRQKFGTLHHEEFGQYMEINVRGPIMVAEAFLSNVRAGDGKKIVAISSTLGSLGEPEIAVNAFWYGASKAALNKVMVTLSAVLKSDKIIVVSMHPGSVRVEKQGRTHAQGMIETPHSVSKMIGTINGLTMQNSGTFLLFDGAHLPW